MDKKIWSKPEVEVVAFPANAYCSSCGMDTFYRFNCDISNTGRILFEVNGNAGGQWQTHSNPVLKLNYTETHTSATNSGDDYTRSFMAKIDSILAGEKYFNPYSGQYEDWYDDQIYANRVEGSNLFYEHGHEGPFNVTSTNLKVYNGWYSEGSTNTWKQAYFYYDEGNNVLHASSNEIETFQSPNRS